MKCYLAKDKDGTYCLFSEKPTRQEYMWRGYEICTWASSKGERFVVTDPPIEIDDWKSDPIECEVIFMV